MGASFERFNLWVGLHDGEKNRFSFKGLDSVCGKYGKYGKYPNEICKKYSLVAEKGANVNTVKAKLFQLY